MRQRPQRKRHLVRIVRLPDQRRHKVPAAHVVHHVREPVAAKRVIPNVLNNRSAIRIRMRRPQLLVGQPRIPRPQQRHNLRQPRHVHYLFMRKHRIRVRPLRQQKKHHRHRGDHQANTASHRPCRCAHALEDLFRIESSRHRSLPFGCRFPPPCKQARPRLTIIKNKRFAIIETVSEQSSLPLDRPRL